MVIRERKTTRPKKAREKVTTEVDKQQSGEAQGFKGERPMAQDKKKTGTFHLDGIPPAPRHVPQIEVTFYIDSNAVLSVSAKDLATGIRGLLETGYFGLYHLVNGGGACSRYDVAVALCRILGRDDVKVEPVSSAYFPLPAPRGGSQGMVNSNPQLLGPDRQRHWREALEAYVTQEL